MTRFRYIGHPTDPSDTHPFVEVFGHRFPFGEPVEVTGSAAGRLAHHAQFEMVTDEVAPPVAVSDSEQSLPQTKEELIAIAELNNIKVDKRWGYDKIAQAIIEHTKAN